MFEVPGNAALLDVIAQIIGRADAEKYVNERLLCVITTVGGELITRGRA
jgi:hypothetical protein